MTSERDWQPVDAGGRVQCPRRGEEVDLARCLDCNWLLDLDRSGRPALRCAVASHALPMRENPHLTLDRGHVD